VVGKPLKATRLVQIIKLGLFKTSKWLQRETGFRVSANLGSEAGSYLRRIDSCISQLKAQVPSRTCNESKEVTDRATVGKPSTATRLVQIMKPGRFKTSKWLQWETGFRVQGLCIPFAALKERCPPRQKSRVERLKAKVEPLLT